jgi:hypothetical protein
MEVSGQLHARPRYPLGNIPRYPFCRTLGGPYRRSGRYGEEKKPLVAVRNRTPIPRWSIPSRYTDSVNRAPNLYSSLDVIKLIKWAGNLALMGA